MSDTINVKRITIDGEKYLIDGDDNLYDPKTQEPIGEYDRDNDEITFFEEEEEEEEEPNFVVKLPYPPSITFNEKEQAYYNKNKKMIDKDVEKEVKIRRDVEKKKYRTQEMVIYNKQIMGDVVNKRIAQIEWDTGKSKDRPYTYNEGFVMEKMKKIKNLYANETDENKKVNQKKVIAGLIPKLQQAKEVDKVEAVSIPKEMEGMEAEERDTKRYLREKAWAEEKEVNRIQAIEDAKLLLTPEEVKSLLTKKNDLVTIVKRPFTAVRFFTKEDKDPYGGNLSGVRDLEYFLPDKIYKVYKVGGTKELIDPDTLQVLGEFEPNKNILSNNYFVLGLNTLGKQRLEEYKKKAGKGIDNPNLYEKAKEVVYKQYPKHSAYRSGQLVKKYKEMGGTYSGKKPKGGLTSWFKEDWKSIGGEYPTYRPTIRVNKDTPLTASEIDPKQAKKQIALKQEIKGDANLPPFLPLEKEGGGLASYTNPKIAKKNAVKYLGKSVVLKPSTKKDKKFMVLNPDTNKFIHFGQLGFEDFTKHQDLKRQKNYLNRTANMKGDWKDDKYSANNLAREILWR